MILSSCARLSGAAQIKAMVYRSPSWPAYRIWSLTGPRSWWKNWSAQILQTRFREIGAGKEDVKARQTPEQDEDDGQMSLFDPQPSSESDAETENTADPRDPSGHAGT